MEQSVFMTWLAIVAGLMCVQIFDPVSRHRLRVLLRARTMLPAIAKSRRQRQALESHEVTRKIRWRAGNAEREARRATYEIRFGVTTAEVSDAFRNLQRAIRLPPQGTKGVPPKPWVYVAGGDPPPPPPPRLIQGG